MTDTYQPTTRSSRPNKRGGRKIIPPSTSSSTDTDKPRAVGCALLIICAVFYLIHNIRMGDAITGRHHHSSDCTTISASKNEDDAFIAPNILKQQQVQQVYSDNNHNHNNNNNHNHNNSNSNSNNNNNNNNNNYDSNRLCEQNQYTKSLSIPLSEYAHHMDTWMSNKVEHERNLTFATSAFEHDWTRFDAFKVMGNCNQTCIGGECRHDLSKIACGVDKDMVAPCVIYSIGGNNLWEFETDVLANTPCEVHTFDCTGHISRFNKIPINDRMHFHHICLGTENRPAPIKPLGGQNVNGEMWTLEKMQNTFNHKQIDLFKMDIEGYEWPVFDSWPVLTDMHSPTYVLPMQILVEIHYRTQMKELAHTKYKDNKFSNDMINLQSHFLQMGFAVVIRDDNKFCKHCTELTLIRIKCPPTLSK